MTWHMTAFCEYDNCTANAKVTEEGMCPAGWYELYEHDEETVFKGYIFCGVEHLSKYIAEQLVESPVTEYKSDWDIDFEGSHKITTADFPWGSFVYDNGTFIGSIAPRANPPKGELTWRARRNGTVLRHEAENETFFESREIAIEYLVERE